MPRSAPGSTTTTPGCARDLLDLVGRRGARAGCVAATAPLSRDNAYIPSWPLVDDRGSRTVQIDTMPILPLLYWAAEESKDAVLHEAGEAHALTTPEHFVRPDHSTVHAVEFDSVSGRPTRKFTFRGYADDLCWSRCQAWAIYGFVATARATRRIEYLQLAERLTYHFLSQLDATLIPFWDFDHPSNPNSARDSSAAAIVASALLDLSGQAAAKPAGDPLASAPSRSAWLARARSNFGCGCRMRSSSRCAQGA